MTLDGFISFLTLLIGGYALIPPLRRMQLRLVARGIVPWSIAAVIGVLYLEFFSLVAFPCLLRADYCDAFELGTEGSLTSQQGAFLVVFAWLLIFLWQLLNQRVRDRDLPALSGLTQQLADEHRFAELLELLQPLLPLIDETARRERPFQKRRDRFTGIPNSAQLDELAADLDEGENGQDEERKKVLKKPCWYNNFTDRFIQWFGMNLPNGTREEEAAHDILRLLLKKRDVIVYMGQNKPRFAAKLLGIGSYAVSEFSDFLLRWMIEHPESALYEEIESTQNLVGVAYEFPNQNVLLRALFDDAELAKTLDVYQPVGETALARLTSVNDPSYCTTLNLPHDVHWDSHGRWRDSTYIAVRFFDIMVRAAAHQGVQWHMWLHYMPHFVKRLERLYDDQGEGVDPEAEWPVPRQHQWHRFEVVI